MHIDRLFKIALQGGFSFVFVFLTVSVSALPVDSKVDAVTVYQEGAMVTRSARVALPRGESTLTFDGLSSRVNASNVRLEVSEGNAELGQVRQEQIQNKDAFDREVRELREQISAVELEIGTLEDRSRTAELKLKFLDGIAAGYAKESWFEGARGNANVESWRAALNVLEDGSGNARQTIRRAKVEIGEQKKELSRLQRELNLVRGGSLSASRLSVAIDSDTAQTVTLQLHYFVDNATWSPVYEARLDSTSGKLRLLQKAEVRQRTDEDWVAAALTLSTSDPSGALAAPDASSLFLDLTTPQARAAKRGRMSKFADHAIEEVVVTASRVQAMPEPEAEPEPVAEVQAYAVNYSIPGRVDVANDADEAQTFELATFEMDATLVTRIVPRQSLDAFLTAQFVYNADVPLYASKLLIYVDRVYVGESWMPTALPGQEMVLPMGQDRQIGFALTDLGGEKGEGGFIGRTKSERTDLAFEVTNRRPSATTVEVIDVLPVAVNKDVDVTLGDDATPATETDFDDKRGVLVWRRALAGGDTWRIRHEYEIEYPANKVLVRQRR